MILLGLASLVLRKPLVERRRRAFGLTFTDRYRRRLEALQVAVGVTLIVFGILVRVFAS
jgi:cytochrome c biogenesis protein CcdA